VDNATNRHHLQNDEVHRRLSEYATKIPEASLIIFDLGKQLLEEAINRSNQIDVKGISVLGWSTAVLGFLLLHGRRIYTSGSVVIIVLGTCGMALAFLAAFSGAWSSRRRRWRGISDEIWFPDPALLTDAEHLRQHYIEELHDSRNSWDQGCRRKAFWLGFGQTCLSLAAFLAALMLLYYVVNSVTTVSTASASATSALDDF